MTNRDMFLAKKNFKHNQANSDDVFHLHVSPGGTPTQNGAVFSSRTKYNEPRHMGNITGLTRLYVHLRIYLIGQRFDYKIRFDEMTFIDEPTPPSPATN